MFNEGDYVKFIGRVRGGSYGGCGVTAEMERDFFNKIFRVAEIRKPDPRFRTQVLSIETCSLTENSSEIAGRIDKWIYTSAMFELFEDVPTPPLEFTYDQFLENGGETR